MDPDPESFNSLFFLITTFSLELFLILFGIVASLFISAFVSGAEVAFFSLSPKDKDTLQNEEIKGADKVLKLMRNPKKLLGMILIINNLVNIGIVILSSYFTGEILKDFYMDFFEYNINLKIFFEIVIITFFLVLFGEILPKVYADQNSLKYSCIAAPLFDKSMKIVSVVNNPLLFLSDKIEILLGGRNKKFSLSHLEQAIEITSDEKTKYEEKKILEGIVTFGNTEARQVMTPRLDIKAISKELSFEEIIEQIVNNGFSRIPVFEENMDKIIGILYIKDIIPFLRNENCEWQKYLRKPFFIPEIKKIDDLLDDFQEKKIHLAIVVDEYGGTSGLVTLEDVIEEIIGEITDEYDEDEVLFVKLDEKNYLFDAKTPLIDFLKTIQAPSEQEDLFLKAAGDSESLAGFIIEYAGRFPKIRESIQFNNYNFLIEQMDKKRIKKIRVIKNV